MAIKKNVSGKAIAKKTTTNKVATKTTTKKATNGIKKVVSKSKKDNIDEAMNKPTSTDNEFMVTVPKIGLKKAVDLVSNALPSKEYNDAKSGIFMEAKYVDDEPMLFLTANSLNVFVKHGITLQEDIGEGFVVPNGNSFRKIVSGLQGLSAPIDLSFNEDDNVFEITCGDDYESMVQHYPVEGFVFPPTEDEIMDNDEITLPVKFIIEALNKVAFSCSNDVTIPELTGVLIEQTSNAINIVGGDGNRLSYLKVNSKTKNPKRVIVGVKYLQLLHSILKSLEVKDSEVISLYLADDKIYFVQDNTTIGIQIFAGEYPIDGGYEQFVFDTNDCEVSITVDTAKFLERLDLATLHNSSTLEPIMMVLNESSKKQKYKFSNTDISSNKFNVDFDVVKYRNDSGNKEVQVSFTPSYLYDVLKALDSKQVVIGLCNLDGPAIVRPIGLKDAEYCHTFSLN